MSPLKLPVRRLAFLTVLMISAAAALQGSGFSAEPSPKPDSVSMGMSMKLPVPEQETLPNGLTVVWFLSDALPVTDIGLLIRSGFRDDPAGKTGTAELLSAALDRGAGGMTATQIAAAIENLGATRYISADEDTFSLGVHGLSSDAHTLLNLLGKVALHPDFPEAEVKREHERMLDRWNHIGDSGETLAGLAFRRLTTSGTTYGRGNFLSVKEFNRVGRADIMEFHRRHFTPGNAVLMVVGRVKKAEFREKILAAGFGAWEGAAPTRNWKAYSDLRVATRKNQILVVDRPNLTQAQVRMGFHAPLVTSPDHYPLVVANALLGEYFNSRLNSLVRDKLGLTYGISSSISYSKDLAVFSINSATRNESVGQLIQKSLEVMKGLKSGPIPKEEVQMAKDYLEGGFPLNNSTLGAVAARWLAGYTFDLGPGYLNEFMPRVDKVTPELVSGAVGRDFPLDQMLIVVAGNAREVEKSLSGAGFHDVRRITMRELF